jgi:hypothetical protein
MGWKSLAYFFCLRFNCPLQTRAHPNLCPKEATLKCNIFISNPQTLKYGKK